MTILVGFAALFPIHPPPVGPFGLVCFAAAAVLSERARERETNVLATSSPSNVTPAGTGFRGPPATV